MCGANGSTASGAFYRNNYGYTGSVSGSWLGRAELDFLASRYSSVYGRASTVQPSAMKAIILIKS